MQGSTTEGPIGRNAYGKENKCRKEYGGYIGTETQTRKKRPLITSRPRIVDLKLLRRRTIRVLRGVFRKKPFIDPYRKTYPASFSGSWRWTSDRCKAGLSVFVGRAW